MASAPEGMTILEVEPYNYEKIIELSQGTEKGPYTEQDLELMRLNARARNSVAMVMFTAPDFWTRYRDIDFNTVVSNGDDGVVSHSYSPECPQGCYGQMDECVYKKEDSGYHFWRCNGSQNCRAEKHANDCPKWEE
jgi:hypothetical protein